VEEVQLCRFAGAVDALDNKQLPWKTMLSVTFHAKALFILVRFGTNVNYTIGNCGLKTGGHCENKVLKGAA
jgi:hypothetical protein